MDGLGETKLTALLLQQARLPKQDEPVGADYVERLPFMCVHATGLDTHDGFER
jgi:hypothetical protein